jgi:HK97 family phage prohead protease
VRIADAASAPLRLAGYAALFDIPDADRDIIEPGAFADTLRARKEPLPLLWQHRPDQVIGTIERIAEDAKGLRVIALVNAVHSRATTALSKGKVNGLSFGYRARRAHHLGKSRRLLAIDLFEISLVTHPLQHGARVHMFA